MEASYKATKELNAEVASTNANFKKIYDSDDRRTPAPAISGFRSPKSATTTSWPATPRADRVSITYKRVARMSESDIRGLSLIPHVASLVRATAAVLSDFPHVANAHAGSVLPLYNEARRPAAKTPARPGAGSDNTNGSLRTAGTNPTGHEPDGLPPA